MASIDDEPPAHIKNSGEMMDVIRRGKALSETAKHLLTPGFGTDAEAIQAWLDESKQLRLQFPEAPELRCQMPGARCRYRC